MCFCWNFWNKSIKIEITKIVRVFAERELSVLAVHAERLTSACRLEDISFESNLSTQARGGNCVAPPTVSFQSICSVTDGVSWPAANFPLQQWQNCLLPHDCRPIKFSCRQTSKSCWWIHLTYRHSCTAEKLWPRLSNPFYYSSGRAVKFRISFGSHKPLNSRIIMYIYDSSLTFWINWPNSLPVCSTDSIQLVEQ